MPREVPFIMTLTPGSFSPLSSDTVPLISAAKNVFFRTLADDSTVDIPFLSSFLKNNQLT